MNTVDVWSQEYKLAIDESIDYFTKKDKQVILFMILFFLFIDLLVFYIYPGSSFANFFLARGPKGSLASLFVMLPLILAIFLFRDDYTITNKAVLFAQNQNKFTKLLIFTPANQTRFSFSPANNTIFFSGTVDGEKYFTLFLVPNYKYANLLNSIQKINKDMQVEHRTYLRVLEVSQQTNLVNELYPKPKSQTNNDGKKMKNGEWI
jgi:hypothetical protein